MAFSQEQVLGTSLSGFNTELVVLSESANEALTSVLDASNNIYVYDNKSLYFGTDKDYNVGVNSNGNLMFSDIGDNELFGINNDGSLFIRETSSQLETLNGNLTYRSDGVYVKI